MEKKNFEIPVLIDELDGQNFGEGPIHVLNLTSIESGMRIAEDALKKDNPRVAIEHFNLFYSILRKSNELSVTIVRNSLAFVIADFRKIVTKLKRELSGDENEAIVNTSEKCHHVTVSVYLLCEYFWVFETNRLRVPMAVNSKKKRRSNSDELQEWFERRLEALNLMKGLLSLSINRLWKYSVISDDFVRIITNGMCCKVLEAGEIVDSTATTNAIFHVIGHLIKDYGQGAHWPGRILDLLYKFEHTPAIMARGVQILHVDYGCKGLLHKLIETMLTHDQTNEPLATSSAKNCGEFLEQAFPLITALFWDEFDLIIENVSCEPSNLRVSVFAIIGELLLDLTVDDCLDDPDDTKMKRDKLLVTLRMYLQDRDSNVRVKILKIYAKLIEENVIPRKHLAEFVKELNARFEDGSVNVRKQAASTLRVVLECNPYGASLNQSKCRDDLTVATKEFATLHNRVRGSHFFRQHVYWGEHVTAITQAFESNIKKPNFDVSVLNFPDDDAACLFFRNAIMLDHNYDRIYDFVVYALQPNDRERLKSDTPTDLVIMLMEVCFYLFRKHTAPLFFGEPLTEEETDALETSRDAQRSRVEFYEEQKEFIALVSACVDNVKHLTRARSGPECSEMLDVLFVMQRFDIVELKAFVNHTLELLRNTEVDRNEIVLNALLKLITPEDARDERNTAREIARNLSKIVCHVNIMNDRPFSKVVELMLEQSTINSFTTIELWKICLGKSAGTSAFESTAAFKMLSYIAKFKNVIVTENFNQLAKVLSARDNVAYERVIITLEMLNQLKEKCAIKLDARPTRYQNDHEIVTCICDFLYDEFVGSNDLRYCTVAQLAINVIYNMTDNPQTVASTLLKRIFQHLADEQSQNVAVPTFKMMKLLHVIGHVAICQIIFMDSTVYSELRRRRMAREQAEKDKKQKRTPLKQTQTGNRMKRNDPASVSSGSLDMSASTAARRLTLSQPSEDDENEELVGANACDVEADFILSMSTNMCDENTLFGRILPVILKIISGDNVHEKLYECAMLTLTKILCVSLKNRKDLIRVLFTVLEKSDNSAVKSNLLLSFVDLLKRYPNAVEPWTKYLFAKLSDASPSVRLEAVVVLSFLILSEMVRVKSNISQMCLCMVDEDATIAASARHFFEQLAMRGNTLYQSLPDIISCLSSDEQQLDLYKFTEIMKFILPLIRKVQQVEHLVEKLCTRLALASSEHQATIFAFCLTLFNHNERSIAVVHQNIGKYKEKLFIPSVRDYFTKLTSQCAKSTNVQMKTAGKQVEDQIQSIFSEDGGDDGPSSTATQTNRAKGKRTTRKR